MTGRDAIVFFEDAGKMVRVGEADLGRDFLDGVSTGKKLGRRLAHFKAGQHRMGAFPGETVKES